MIQIKKVLFPTDFSNCANQALDHALYMAARYKGELHMLHAIVLHEDDPYNPVHHFQDVSDLYARLRENARTQMKADIEGNKTEELVIKTEQERGIAAAPVILEYAKKNDVDLIVMGTHGRRGLEHFLLGSVAEEVVREAQSPVLTIRERKQPQPVETIEKILVPVDFSEHAKSAVSHAKELAGAYQAKLQLLHVIEESIHPAFYATGKTSIFDLMPDIKTKSGEALEKLIKETEGPEVKHEFHIIEGRASQDIVKFAKKQKSDLIVISTHGLTGVEHLLLGSVAEKVIRMAPCPVFTVKAFGKKLF